MAFDDRLANRVRRALRGRRNVTVKKMFGGLAFLDLGRMVCGVLKDDLVVRVGAERFEAAQARPGARPMDFTGRPMRGFVYVAPEGCRTARDLRRWIEDGFAGAAASTTRTKKSPLKKEHKR